MFPSLRGGGGPAQPEPPVYMMKTLASSIPAVYDRVTRDQYSIGVGLDLVNVQVARRSHSSRTLGTQNSEHRIKAPVR